VYGFSCSVSDTAAIKAIRTLKSREQRKPLIVLIASLRDLEHFGVTLTEAHGAFLKRVWPGAVSVVFSGVHESFSHIAHNNSLAIRMPEREDLRAFITRVGPIVSTSVNHAGETPATTVSEVVSLFPEGIHTIVDTGACAHPPSTVVQILR
jgi:L-threonylcarbamoyladenylate synthase